MTSKTQLSRVWKGKVAVVATSLLLAIALLCGAFRAGGRYFYCEAMGMMLTDPCAAAAAAAPDAPPPAHELRERDVDCCIVGTLPPMPAGAASREVRVGAAPFVAIVPGRVFAALAQWLVAGDHREASGPRAALPRPPGAARARLMVFLT